MAHSLSADRLCLLSVPHRARLRPRFLSRLAVFVLALGWTIAPVSPLEARGGDDRVEALLMVRSVAPSLMKERQAPVSEFEFELFRRTQAELILTPVVFRAALHSAEIAELPLLARQKDPVGWLRSMIRVDFPGDAELMRVSMRGGSEQEAKIVNAVVEAYLDEVVDRDKRQLSSNFELLLQTSETLRQQIAREHDGYKRLSDSLGSTSKGVIETEQKLALEQISTLRQLIYELGMKKLEAMTQRELLRLQQAEPWKAPEHLVQQELGKDPEIAIRLPRLFDLESQLTEVRIAASPTEDGGEPPQVVRFTRLIEAEQSALARRTDKLRPAIEAELRARSKGSDDPDVASLERQIQMIDAQIAEAKANETVAATRLKKLSGTSPELYALERKIEQLEISYSKVAAEVRALEVELKSPSRVKLIQPATAME